MLTQVPVTEWRSLLEVALKFSSANPWEWIQDSQVVAVVHPTSGESIYCSVLGSSGEMKALAMYPGKQGWKSYLAIGSEDLDTDPTELVYSQECLILSFDAPQQAEADDLTLFQHAGFSIEGAAWVPSFRSYRPGYLPNSPERKEVAWMQTVVEQVIALIGELPGSGEYIPEDGLNEEGKLLTWVQTQDGWQFEWRLPVSVLDFSPATVLLDAEDKSRAKGLPQEQAIWLLEEFHLPEPALDEQGVAFFPYVFLFFDVEQQEFRGITLLQPGDYPDGLGSLLVEMMAQQGRVPAQLVVTKRANLILMRPFCQALGIGIHLEESFDIREDLKVAVQEMLGDPEE